MSLPTRNISNPPAHYFNLTTRQQRNWRQHTRKIERNEKSRSQYPTYCPASNINIVHLHHRTEITTIDQLIQQAKTTKRFTVDTESQRGQRENNGALVQIEMVHSINYSTVILMEICYLPDVDSILFERFKELWLIIFNSGNEIITWGPLAKEFKDFQHLEWMKLGNIKKKNLQSLFQDWQDGIVAHPETESREMMTGVSLDTPGDDDYDDSEDECYTNYNDTNDKTKYSLQKAVAITLHNFLDKVQTVNDWNCGLELLLGTWRSKIFSKKYYNEQVEKQQRIKMIEYAVHDCTSVTEIYFVMYLEQTETTINKNITTTATTRTTINDTPKPTPIISNEHEDYFSDVSEEEIDIYITQPRPEPINKPNTETNIIIHQPHELIITTTQQEINELNQIEPQAEQQKQTRKTTAEQQRHKNMKYKLKKKYHPDFQKKIKRAIYAGYDYRKIRAQLMDDNIHTSHQIKIHERKQEVVIGFKTREEFNRATCIMRANYFSKQQYQRRWQ